MKKKGVVESIVTETYEISVYCPNCGHPMQSSGEVMIRKIPKGTIAEEYLKEIPCEYCGCKTLKRSNR